MLQWQINCSSGDGDLDGNVNPDCHDTTLAWSDDIHCYDDSNCNGILVMRVVTMHAGVFKQKP